MRPLTLLLTSLFILLIGAPAFAGDMKSDKQMDPKAMMELYKKMATPGEPHKMLTSLAGSWTTQTKSWMMPGKPPVETTGTAEIKTLLDGRYIYQEFNGEMMGHPFSGIGIDGYDNVKKKFVTAWIDTMGTGIFIMDGSASADGKTITLHGQHPEPSGEGHMKHRAIWTIIDKNNQTFHMYGTHHGTKEMKMMEITYKRK